MDNTEWELRESSGPLGTGAYGYLWNEVPAAVIGKKYIKLNSTATSMWLKRKKAAALYVLSSRKRRAIAFKICENGDVPNGSFKIIYQPSGSCQLNCHKVADEFADQRRKPYRLELSPDATLLTMSFSPENKL